MRILDKQKLIEDFVKSFKLKLNEESHNRTGRLSGEDAAEYLKIHGSDSELFGDKFENKFFSITHGANIVHIEGGHSISEEGASKVASILKTIFNSYE